MAETCESLRKQLKAMTAERDEADRAAGAALRRLEYLEASERRQRAWLSEAKRDAGCDDNVSFDVVWAAALKALLATD